MMENMVVQKFICLLVLTFVFMPCIISCDTENLQFSETAIETSEKYILNISSKKIHKEDCGTAKLMLEKNRREYFGEKEDLLRKGYTTCGNCFR